MNVDIANSLKSPEQKIIAARELALFEHQQNKYLIKSCLILAAYFETHQTSQNSFPSNN
jgi:hypothetical protein